MSKLTVTIRKAMLDKGHRASAKYLAEIIKCTPQNASNKLNGKTPFKDYELGIISKQLDIPDEVLMEAIKEVKNDVE